MTLMARPVVTRSEETKRALPDFDRRVLRPLAEHRQTLLDRLVQPLGLDVFRGRDATLEVEQIAAIASHFPNSRTQRVLPNCMRRKRLVQSGTGQRRQLSSNSVSQ